MLEITSIEFEPEEIETLKAIGAFCGSTECGKCPLTEICEDCLEPDTTLRDFCTRLLEEYV